MRRAAWLLGLCAAAALGALLLGAMTVSGTGQMQPCPAVPQGSGSGCAGPQ